jgi:UDP-N-acetylglucosamine acyltransferase
LRRNGVSKESIEQLDRLFKVLFNSGLTKAHALERIAQETAFSVEAAYLVDFVKNSQRGLSRSCNVE